MTKHNYDNHQVQLIRILTWGHIYIYQVYYLRHVSKDAERAEDEEDDVDGGVKEPGEHPAVALHARLYGDDLQWNLTRIRIIVLVLCTSIYTASAQKLAMVRLPPSIPRFCGSSVDNKIRTRLNAAAFD